MCRLFALISPRKVDEEFHQLMRPFQRQAVEHPHGWGIGWYEEGKAKLIKRPVSAYQNPEFLSTADSIRSYLVIAHIRKSSTSSHILENTHPFMYDNWLFAHNGGICCTDQIKRNLPEGYQSRIKGQTDSEVYFQWLLYNIDQRKIVEEGIRDAILDLKENWSEDTSAMNFLLSNGQKLFAYRCAFKKVTHYSLNHLQREDMIVVSSDPLTDETWTPMANDDLLSMDRELETDSISV